MRKHFPFVAPTILLTFAYINQLVNSSQNLLNIPTTDEEYQNMNDTTVLPDDYKTSTQPELRFAASIGIKVPIVYEGVSFTLYGQDFDVPDGNHNIFATLEVVPRGGGPPEGLLLVNAVVSFDKGKFHYDGVVIHPDSTVRTPESHKLSVFVASDPTDSAFTNIFVCGNRGACPPVLGWIDSIGGYVETSGTARFTIGSSYTIVGGGFPLASSVSLVLDRFCITTFRGFIECIDQGTLIETLPKVIGIFTYTFTLPSISGGYHTLTGDSGSELAGFTFHATRLA